MTRLQSRLRDERGMTLVMVATGLVAFLSATMLAVDVGMLMVARTEAQSAADAGALAGAVALAFDDFDDRIADRPGRSECDRRLDRGRQRGHERAGVGASRQTSHFRRSTASACACSAAAPVATRSRRSSRRCSASTPSISAPIATAEASPANAMTCVKPFTVPDKWIERQTPPWDPDDTFDAFDNKGKAARQSGHLHSDRPDRLHGLQRRYAIGARSSR